MCYLNPTQPIGCLTLSEKIKVKKDSPGEFIKDIIPISELSDLEFLAWDPIKKDAYESASECAVLEHKDIEHLKSICESEVVELEFDDAQKISLNMADIAPITKSVEQKLKVS